MASINEQKDRINKYVDSMNWKVKKEYSDARDDFNDDKAFQIMLQDGILRKFDCVVINSVYSCGKSLWHAEELFLKTFYPAGIQFIVLEDNFNSFDKSHADVCEYFKMKRDEHKKEKVVNLMYARRAQGLLSKSDIKYGYVLSNDLRGLVIEEETAEIVRSIYQSFIDGQSYVNIRKRLENENALTPAMYHRKYKRNLKETSPAIKWSVASIKFILSEPAYKGELVKTYEGKQVNYKCEPIVSAQDFERVQSILEEKKPKTKKKLLGRDILSGRVFCLETGNMMVCNRVRALNNERRFILEKEQRSLAAAGKLPYIAYDRVKNALMEALDLEKKRAEFFLQLLESQEIKEALSDEQELYSNQAQMIFRMIVPIDEARISLYAAFESGEISCKDYETQKAEIQRKILSFESDFEEIGVKMSDLRVLYGVSNPWLNLFKDMEIPNELELKHLQKYLDKIYVSNLETVTVSLKESKWRDRMPEKLWKVDTRG